jgi:hypothetical protein
MKNTFTLLLSLMIIAISSAQSLNGAVVSSRLLRHIAAHPEEPVLVLE